MSTTGLEVFDTTLQKTNVWLNEVMDELGWNDERMDPEQIARGVFRVLARHISEGEIEDIKHVLPAELRALWSQEPPTTWV